MTYLKQIIPGHRSNYPLYLEQTGFGSEAQSILEKEQVFISHFGLPVSRSYSNPYVKFESNKIQWMRETQFFSSVESIAMHPAYQRIIGMGMEAVPYILQELSKESRQWFWALKAITNVDPVQAEDRGRVKRMAKAWVKWGQEQGLV